MEAIEPWLVGVVRAPISCLVFPSPCQSTRLYNERSTAKKETLFEYKLCEPNLVGNQILAEIDRATLKIILTKLQTNCESLRGSDVPYPLLPPGIKLKCQDGRSRIEAIRRQFDDNFLWTIRLYYAKPQGESI